MVEAANTADARLALADFYLGTKRPADAVAVLETLGADPAYWAVARARIADIQHAQGKTAEAFAIVDDVVAKKPTLAAARVVRGRLYLDSGRVDDALKDAQEGVRLDRKSIEAHYLLGTVFEAKRDVDAAAKSFGEVLRLNPRAVPAQVRLAMIQMQRNEFPAATQLAEQAAARQPGNLAANLVLARSLLAQGDVDRATAITRSLLQGAPQVAAVQNQAGMLALAKGDKAGARIAFEQALSVNDLLVEPLAALVALDIAEQQPARARARVEQRLQKTPNASGVLVLAGRTWAATGDVAKGEQFLHRAIDADASNVDAYALLAGLYLSQKKLDQAVAEFDALAARQPGAIGPPTMAAVILQGQGKEDEARRRYERLVEANPAAAVAANNLAWMYASRGEQLDRALQLAQAAKAKLPDHPSVNDTLGFVYIKKQLPSLAIPPLRFAVEKDPGNAAFHYHLGLAYSQITDEKVAARRGDRAGPGAEGEFRGGGECATAAEDASSALTEA